MPSDAEPFAATLKPCPMVSDPDTADLTWLMNRAAAVLGDDFDRVAKAAGLRDLRDWLVLAVVCDGQQRTQLEIARIIGLDKTTLVAMLDRLEKEGLVVRALSASDRRVRIPAATEAGRRICEGVRAERERAVNERLDGIPEHDRLLLRELLWRIAGPREGALPAGAR